MTFTNEPSLDIENLPIPLAPSCLLLNFGVNGFRTLFSPAALAHLVLISSGDIPPPLSSMIILPSIFFVLWNFTDTNVASASKLFFINSKNAV